MRRLAALACLLLLASGCQRADPRAAGGLVGPWVFTEETRSGFSRSCAPLLFAPDAPATFTIDPGGDRFRIAFNDQLGTVMTGQLEGATLVARHLVPTSEIGRVCSQDLRVVVRLRRADAGGEERLEGSWRPAECAICPGVVLSARRPEARRVVPARLAD